ncbi:DUF3726 domain-containing protein [Candidatus Pelagibacter sp.]|nr:DUF3726 domain-containing protein [Candidatus Pelagibacter sp.]
MKSLSEIEMVSKRSSKATGFSWGIAEEIGKNIRMLEMFGLSGIKNLNYYFKVRNVKKFEKLNLINKENKTPKAEFCPIIAGISFLDQVRSLENFGEINFEKIAYPLLFLPFVSRASEIIGKKIKLKIDNKVFLLNFNNSIYSNSLNGGIIEKGNIVLVSFEENKDSFDEEEWKNLYKLSENTFVEESESLKVAGAGAGLTDND